jgi:predicted transcriptional regulator
MKAISIKQPYASLIMQGIKKLEVRSRNTHIRGDVLVCVSKTKILLWQLDEVTRYSIGDYRSLYKNTGCAIGIIEITGSREMRKEDEDTALVCFNPELYVWELANPRLLKSPFSVCGNTGFFNVDLHPSQLECM